MRRFWALRLTQFRRDRLSKIDFGSATRYFTDSAADFSLADIPMRGDSGTLHGDAP